MPKTKLTMDEMEHLLKVAKTGLLTQQQIAEDWGVSKGYVSRLVRGKYERKGATEVRLKTPIKGRQY
jgi:predicted XRE-type DNA-binding protein